MCSSSKVTDKGLLAPGPQWVHDAGGGHPGGGVPAGGAVHHRSAHRDQGPRSDGASSCMRCATLFVTVGSLWQALCLHNHTLVLLMPKSSPSAVVGMEHTRSSPGEQPTQARQSTVRSGQGFAICGVSGHPSQMVGASRSTARKRTALLSLNKQCRASQALPDSTRLADPENEPLQSSQQPQSTE